MNFILGFVSGLLAMTLILGIVQTRSRREGLSEAMSSVFYNQECYETIKRIK